MNDNKHLNFAVATFLMKIGCMLILNILSQLSEVSNSTSLH